MSYGDGCFQNEEFGLNDMSTSAFETGVDSTYALPVPVDPQVYLGNYTKGPDHPTYFAKGVYENDNTVGGKCCKLCSFVTLIYFLLAHI